MGMKLIYRKSLAIELIKMGNDLQYTSRNRKDSRWQVYFFKDSLKLRQDMCKILGLEYIETKQCDKP